MNHLSSSIRTAFRSRVLKIDRIASDVISIRIQTPFWFQFRPGQWIDVMVAKDETIALQQLSPNYVSNNVKEFSVEMRDDPNHRDNVYNVTGFSMTCSPFVKEHISLGIKLTDHPITRFIHKHVQEGHVLNVAGPDGVFMLPDVDTLFNKYNGNIVLIAAGIGITPLLSMLHYVHDINKELKNEGRTLKTTLLYSSKTLVDIYFKNDIIDLCNADQDLSIHFFATKDQSNIQSKLGKRVTLHSGRINKHIINSCINDATAQTALFMLCGPQTFINSIEELLKERCVALDRILYEKWW
jgi:ferredoxin-NADP reductase